MEVVPSMDKPLRVRQKQPCVDSGPDPEGAAADVITLIAFLWVEQTPLCAALRQLTCEAGVLRALAGKLCRQEHCSEQHR